MVKSGEVYYTSSPVKDGPYLVDDSRPRNIMTPHGTGYRVWAAVQANLWTSIKKAEPGFIQGMTSE
jgi:endo-1,4-beta-D-glucanase Y